LRELKFKGSFAASRESFIREWMRWVHVKLNYVRVIKLHVSSRTIADAPSLSAYSWIRCTYFCLSLSLSSSIRFTSATNLGHAEWFIRSTPGRTYICNISFVLRAYFRTKRSRIRNFRTSRSTRRYSNPNPGLAFPLYPSGEWPIFLWPIFGRELLKLES